MKNHFAHHPENPFTVMGTIILIFSVSAAMIFGYVIGMEDKINELELDKKRHCIVTENNTICYRNFPGEKERTRKDVEGILPPRVVFIH